jgi:predicted transcriptional regulator
MADPTVTKSRQKYPYVFGVRLSLDDNAKLRALAENLGQKPSETLRYLLRKVTSAEAIVHFGTREQWDRDGICVD